MIKVRGFRLKEFHAVTALVGGGFVTDSKKFMSNLGVLVIVMFLWHKMHSLSHSAVLLSGLIEQNA